MNGRFVETDYGKIYYNLTGAGKPIVFLHGWGQNSETFSQIIPHFEKDFLVLCIDLPGFGKSSEPARPLTLADYLEGVLVIFSELGIKNPVVVGHSFGGRIAIRIAEKIPLAALILVSSAGIRKRSLKRFLRIYLYKAKKTLFRIVSKEKYQRLVNTSGSRDFRNASPVMKRTLSNIVSEDLGKNLKRIKTKTYLLWGIHDQETPYRDAILMNTLLQNAFLIPFYESGHFCYQDEERKFIRTLKQILSEEDIWKQSKT